MKKRIFGLYTTLMYMLILVGCGGSSTEDTSRSQVQDEQLDLLERGFVLSTPYGLEVQETLPISSQIVEENTDSENLNYNLTHDYNWTLIPNTMLQGIQPIQSIDFTQLESTETDLFIISHKDFVEELEPLKQHKNATGMLTKIFSWQKLVTQFDGRDDAEKIKKAIAYYAQKLKIQYVMLVGDVDKFPVRYCKVYDNVHWGDGWVSTDLYYADIYKNDTFASWDENKNNLFCESTSTESNPTGKLLNLDQIEAGVDIPVGRIPASTANEVANYVNKIIEYENGGYEDYMNNALLLVPGDDKGNDTYPNSTILKDYVAKQFSDSSINVIKKYHNLRSEDISNVIENGVGLINFAGHGAPWGWDFGYNNIDSKWTSFSINSIFSLRNQNRFPIVFSVACSTGRYIFDKKFKAKDGEDFDLSVTCRYDPENDIQGCLPAPKANSSAEYIPEPNATQPPEYDLDSMAEFFLVKNIENGAIGFIGSTDATQGAAQTIDQYFSYIYSLGFLLRKDTTLTNPTLGGFWKYTINTYRSNHVNMNEQESSDWTKSIPFGHLLKYHLFGDPSLRIGGLR